VTIHAAALGEGARPRLHGRRGKIAQKAKYIEQIRFARRIRPYQKRPPTNGDVAEGKILPIFHLNV